LVYLDGLAAILMKKKQQVIPKKEADLGNNTSMGEAEEELFI